MVKLIENLLELRRRQLNTPVLENVLQFVIFDKPILFNVEVSKCLLEGAPLYRKFLDYHSLDSRQVSLLRQTFSNAFLQLLIFLDESIEPWVFHRIVPEVKTLSLVN